MSPSASDSSSGRGRGPLEARHLWPAIAIAVAWLLFAITMHGLGEWRERTNRYDGCEPMPGATHLWFLCQGPLLERPSPASTSDV